MYRLDKLWIGLIIGLCLPLLVATTYITYINGWKMFVVMFDTLSIPLFRIVSLGAIGNLLFFYLFLNRRMYSAVKGVILATMLFAFSAVIIYL